MKDYGRKKMTRSRLLLSLCWFCKHFDSSGRVVASTEEWAIKSKSHYFSILEDEDFRCTAFPEGVPPLIFGIGSEYAFTNFPQFDHREPIGVDNGITFTLANIATLKQRPPFINHDYKNIKKQYAETLDYINVGRLHGYVLPTKKSASK
jgi:hypothetical protein